MEGKIMEKREFGNIKLSINFIEDEKKIVTTIRRRNSDGYVNADDIINLYNEITGKNKKVNQFYAHQDKNIIQNYTEERSFFIDGNREVLSKSLDNINKAEYNWIPMRIMLEFLLWLIPEFDWTSLEIVYNYQKGFIITGRNISINASGSRNGDCLDINNKNYYVNEDNYIKELIGLEKDQDWGEMSKRQANLKEKLKEASYTCYQNNCNQSQWKNYLKNLKELFDHKN